METSLRRIALNASEISCLNETFVSVRSTPYGDGFAAFVDEIALLANQLPARLISALTEFRTSIGRAAALMVGGLPIADELPPTPSGPRNWTKSDTIGSEAQLLACALQVGWPVGFADWHDGARVQNLFPIEKLRETQCASNAVRLDFHTETAFRTTTPDGVMLLCLRPDEEGRAETAVADLRASADTLSHAARNELAKPQFAFRLSDGQLTEPRAIICSDTAGKERFNYAAALVGTTAAANHSLASLAAAIEESAESVHLVAGDLLVIDNRHMVHARSPICARYDGRDRWLQRVLLRCSRESRGVVEREVGPR